MAGVPAGRLSIEIVAEIARLQADLDKAKRAVNAASRDIAKSASDANSSLGQIGGAANDNFGRMTKASGAAQFAMRNLSFQVQDVITQLSLGQDPMRVFAAQGFQIADALSQLRAEANRTDQSMLSLITGGFGKAGPAILAVVAAAATLAGGLKILQDDINETSNTNATFAQTALGVWDGMVAYVQGTFAPVFEWLANVIGTAWKYIADAAKAQFNTVVSFAVAVPKTIYAAFRTLPAAISELFINMANGAIKAVEDLVNKTISGLNKFAGVVNGLLGTSLGGIGNVSFGRIEQGFAGAGSRAGAAMSEAFFGSFRDYASDVGAYFTPFVMNRMKGGAEEAGTKAGKAGGKAGGKAMADEWAKAFDDNWKQFIENLTGQLGGIDKMIAAFEKQADADWKAMQAGWAEDEASAQRIRDAEAIWAEQHRRKTLQTAYEVADIIGGSIGDALGDLVEGLDKAFPKLASTLSEKFGGIFKVLDKMGAGAQIGGAVDGIFDAIGIKSSKTGAQIGGAIGQFAGPLGAIAGSIAGGIIGGMLKSTPRASATISVIAGEAMDTAIKGSSGKLKEAAGQMADRVIAGLTDLASALGAELTGNASVSVGMRNGKYRVDPTGSGITKTSKGAIDFGKDGQAAAIVFALQDAIKDGVLGGLSASLEKLITGDGDLQVQLQKALSFKGVFDELRQRDDPAQFAQDEITRWYDSMAKIFAEAGATGEELAELERLTGIKRADAAKEAADKVAEAERAAQERANEIRDKNIELLQAQGKVEEAEAMARQARIDDAPEYVRLIQQQIEAANLLADAEQKLLESRQAAQQIMQQFFALDERLAAAQGDDETVKRLQRENELRNATSELERTYLLAIFAAENLKIAQDAQAAAAKALADAAAAAAAELAAAQKAIDDEISSLERQYLQATGQTDALRQLQLGDLLSDRAREIQQSIWDYNDALERQKLAQEAATAALEEYNRRLEDARNALSAAYERESSALQQTIDKFRDFASTIRDFRLSLIAANDNSVVGSRSRFMDTARLARAGNDNAVGNFAGDANSFLEAAMGQARTRTEYQDQVAFVTRTAADVEKALGTRATYEERQLDLLTKQVAQYIDLTNNVLSVQEAIVNLQSIEQENLPVITDTLSAGFQELGDRIENTEAKKVESEKETRATIEYLLDETRQMRRKFDSILVVGGNVSTKEAA